MVKQTKHLIDEADIGSGDKTHGQHETEKMIEEVGKNNKTPVPYKDMQEKHDGDKKQKTIPEKNQ